MTSVEATRVHYVDLKELRFDARNPRLRGEEGQDLTQQHIFEALWEDFAVDEVAASIATNGYFPYEPLFVATEDGEEVVVEGNRRLAALKALTNEMRAAGVPASKLSKAERDKLRSVPVIWAARAELWQYVGFKHVNGPQSWRSASKASYIAWVHNDLRVPLDEIALRIGDQHSTVQRFYRALMVIEQAEDADVWQRSDRWKEHFSFSHLYTGLDYGGISKFVGIRSTADEAKRPVPLGKLAELGELCRWLFGSKSRNQQPLVQSQNPDLRILDEIVQSKNGIAAVRQGLPLRISQDVSKGDSQLLREAMVSAKEYLQLARGRVLTGFDGQNDLIAMSDDILELAEAVNVDLRNQQTKARAARRATKSAAT